MIIARLVQKSCFLVVLAGIGQCAAIKLDGEETDPLSMIIPVRKWNDKDILAKPFVPYLFHVPKAAGSTLERVLDAEKGMRTLPSGDAEDLEYLERSKAIHRGIIQYIKTPLFSSACAYFGRAGVQAKVFTILREPVDRLESLFWYRKHSSWEKDYDPFAINESYGEFIKKEPSDWLVKMLSAALPQPWNIPSDAGLPQHLSNSTRDEPYLAARYVLLDRIVYGFVDDIDNSIGAIFAAFGWEWTPGDASRLSTNVNEKPRTSSAQQTDLTSDFREQLLANNLRDVALYNEARQLYITRKKELKDGQ